MAWRTFFHKSWNPNARGGPIGAIGRRLPMIGAGPVFENPSRCTASRSAGQGTRRRAQAWVYAIKIKGNAWSAKAQKWHCTSPAEFWMDRDFVIEGGGALLRDFQKSQPVHRGPRQSTEFVLEVDKTSIKKLCPCLIIHHMAVYRADFWPKHKGSPLCPKNDRKILEIFPRDYRGRILELILGYSVRGHGKKLVRRAPP